METSRSYGFLAKGALIAAFAGCAGDAGCGGPQLNLGGGGDSGCVPGNYSGPFSCDASFAAGPASPGGNIGFKLQGEPHGQGLRIAPGTDLGMELGGGVTSIAEVSGTLDCTTNKLVGNLSNVMLKSSAVNLTFLESGGLTADYDARAVPALVNGQMSFSVIFDAAAFFPDGGAFLVPDAAASATSCAWAATLQQ
jgi:hypothetical protein